MRLYSLMDQAVRSLQRALSARRVLFVLARLYSFEDQAVPSPQHLSSVCCVLNASARHAATYRCATRRCANMPNDCVCCEHASLQHLSCGTRRCHKCRQRLSRLIGASRSELSVSAHWASCMSMRQHVQALR